MYIQQKQIFVRLIYLLLKSYVSRFILYTISCALNLSQNRQSRRKPQGYRSNSALFEGTLSAVRIITLIIFAHRASFENNRNAVET